MWALQQLFASTKFADVEKFKKCQLQNSEVEDFTEMADEFYIDANISHKITIHGRCFLLQGKKATIFHGAWMETKAVLREGFDDLHCLAERILRRFTLDSAAQFCGKFFRK
jgi:hypothetical protein